MPDERDQKENFNSFVSPSIMFPNVKLTLQKYRVIFFYFLGHHTKSTHCSSSLALPSLVLSYEHPEKWSHPQSLHRHKDQKQYSSQFAVCKAWMWEAK